MAQEENLLDAVKTMSSAVDENFLELASALRTLQDTNTEELQKAIDASGLGRRKAYYLITIDRVFSTIPVPKLRLKKIGWTKLKELSAHITKQNYAELLKAAEKYTAKQLGEFLSGQTPETDKKAFLVYLRQEDYAELSEAIVRVGGIRYQRGFSNKREALVAMSKTLNAIPDDVLQQYLVKAKDAAD